MARIYALTAAAMLLLAGRAEADCTVQKMAELPVRISGPRMLVTAQINGSDAAFLVDSGAFFSTIATKAAIQRGLKLEPPPPNLRVYGVGGQVRVDVVTVKSFTLDGAPFADVDFIAGSDFGPGVAGLLGLNVLRYADVEYDFTGHMIRLLRPKGCETANLGYWPSSRGVSVLPLEAQSREKPHAIGHADVSGVHMRVMFDTGASSSVLSLAAARRAGIRTDSPGVVPSGPQGGMNRQPLPTWIAPVESFELGGEQIKNTHLRIGEIGVAGLESPDMLLGADFFRSHHVLISNSQHKVYFTYEGGPVFDLTHPPQPAAAPPPSPPAPAS